MTTATKSEGKAETPVAIDNAAAGEEALIALGTATPKEEVHQRKALSKGGTPVLRDGHPLMLSYVTARFVQDRLDSVVGPGCWQSTFENLPSGAVRCGIGILVARGDNAEWIWKWDVGIPSSIEPDKGAHSDAFKRAAVQWGIARDLYDERDDAVPAAEPAKAKPTQNVREKIEGNSEPKAEPEVVDDSGWICPIHEEVKTVPAGVSQKTGRRYNAFRACPVPGCDEKEPFKR